MANLGKSVSYLFMAEFMLLITGYAVHFFLGRHLGPAEYGIYGVILTLMTTITLILATGIPTAVSKLISEDIRYAEYIKRKALRLQVLSSIIIAVIYFLSAGFFAYLLRDSSLIGYIRLSALVFPTYSLFAIYLYYFNGLQKFGKQAILITVYSILKLLLVIILVLMMEIYGAILGFVISPLIAFIFAMFIKKGGQYEERREVRIYGKMIKFALPIIVLSVFLNVLLNIDLWFVKAILTDVETGFYTASSMLTKMVYMAMVSVTGVLFPAISASIASKSLERTRSLIGHSLRYLTLGLLPVIAYFSIRSDRITSMVYGQEYISAWQSLSILIFGITFLILFFTFATIMNASGKPKKSMYMIIVGLIISIALNYTLIPRYGLIGAASATTIAGAVILLISGISVKRQFGLRLRGRFFFNTLSALALSCLVILLFSFMSSSKFIIIPESMLFFSVYFALLIFVFKELTKVDIKRVQEAVPFSSKFRFLFEFLGGV